MQKLKNSEVKPTRDRLWAANRQRCGLCGLPLAQQDAVLDHCHERGHVRDSIHRRCNSLLGKLENNAPRFGFPKNNPGLLAAFLQGAGPYLAKNAHSRHGLIHPLHKTEEEKKAKRALAQRVRRAKAKETK